MDEYEYEGVEPLVVPAQLRGYRCWRLERDNDVELFPLHADFSPPWPRRRWAANCDRGLLADNGRKKHANAQPPVKACECGFYATYGPKDYLDHIPKAWDEFDGKQHRFIHGSVIATGRVILGTKGFRAQYAEIEALWGWRSYFIAAYYNVPWFLTRRRFLKHFPPHSVATLLKGRVDIDKGMT